MTRRRVSVAYVEHLVDRLSERDMAVVEAVGRVRVHTGRQLERLCFANLEQPSRSVVRRRVLARLVSLRVLTTLERRIGGARAGSQGLVFALDTAGQQLLELGPRGVSASGERLRRPWTPGRLFLRHTLAVSELYVRLSEAAYVEHFVLSAFLAEPVCWWPNGLGGWLKPDAYAVLATAGFRDSYWWEVDQATESMSTVRRKLQVYADFVARGQLGPDDVIPRVLITVPDEQRQAAVAALDERESKEVIATVATEFYSNREDHDGHT